MSGGGGEGGLGGDRVRMDCSPQALLPSKNRKRLPPPEPVNRYDGGGPHQCKATCVLRNLLFQQKETVTENVSTEPTVIAVVVVVVEALLYVHRNRRLIRVWSPRHPPRLSHTS